jgi:hypothetical protein
MALNKKIIKDNGVETNYHRITQVNFSITEFNGEEEKHLSTRVTSYLNEEYRDNNKPIDDQYFNFALAADEDVAADIRALAYEKLKTLELWADATDC